jgi:very-short-patch-repair endonuclease
MHWWNMTHHRTNRKTFSRSRLLRQNLTPAENELWYRLNNNRLGNIHFRRQHAIGPYIVDFCAAQRKLIIEIDGSQHNEQKEYDAERTAFLNQKGYRVIRFWNHEIENNIETVLEAILQAAKRFDQE